MGLNGKVYLCFPSVMLHHTLEEDEAKMRDNGNGDLGIVIECIEHEHPVWDVQHHLCGSMN